MRDLILKAAFELTQYKSIFTLGVDCELELQQLFYFLRRLRCCTLIMPYLSVYGCYRQKICICTRKPCYRKETALRDYNFDSLPENAWKHSRLHSTANEAGLPLFELFRPAPKIRSFNGLCSKARNNRSRSYKVVCTHQGERTCTVSYRPVLRRRPHAVIIVAEILVSWHDSEVKPIVTWRLTFDTVLMMSTDQFTIARRDLIGTSVFCMYNNNTIRTQQL